MSGVMEIRAPEFPESVMEGAVAGRASSASAAAGYAELHRRRQETLVAQALGDAAT